MKSALKALVIAVTLFAGVASANAAESILPSNIDFSATNGSFQVAVNILKFWARQGIPMELADKRPVTRRLGSFLAGSLYELLVP